MKKTLLQPEVKQELVERIHNLKPEAQNLWGKMNVHQMLYHANEGIKIAYGDLKVTVPKGSWIKGAMLRFFVMKTNFETPKEKAETFPELNTVERGIYPTDFEELRRQLVESVKKFPLKHTLPVHPFMGKFSDEHWARLNYTHLDHHLKQFGV